MSQSFFGGATSYEEQSITSIKEDIDKWKKYTIEVSELLTDGLEKSKENSFWNKVDFDFQLTILTSIEYLKTIQEDLSIIEVAIEDNHITEREVKLLWKIGNKAVEYNNEYGRTYKAEKRFWHDYGNPKFRIIETMYAEGRDFFVSLQDATNAAARLEDYMASEKNTIITFNGNVNVEKSQIQIGTNNSTQITSTSDDFPFEKVYETLMEIKKYTDNELFDTEFGEKAVVFKKELEETVSIVEKKEEGNKVKAALGKLKNLSASVASGIIANGIFNLITTIL